MQQDFKSVHIQLQLSHYTTVWTSKWTRVKSVCLAMFYAISTHEIHPSANVNTVEDHSLKLVIWKGIKGQSMKRQHNFLVTVDACLRERSIWRVTLWESIYQTSANKYWRTQGRNRWFTLTRTVAVTTNVQDVFLAMSYVINIQSIHQFVHVKTVAKHSLKLVIWGNTWERSMRRQRAIRATAEKCSQIKHLCIVTIWAFICQRSTLKQWVLFLKLQTRHKCMNKSSRPSITFSFDKMDTLRPYNMAYSLEKWTLSDHITLSMFICKYNVYIM